MSRGIIPVIAVVAAGVGFAAGWATRAPAPSPVVATVTGEIAEPTQRVAAAAATAPTRRATTPDRGTAPAVDDGTDETIQGLLDDANELRRQLREAKAANRALEQRLSIAEATRREAEGVPFQRPAVVPERHTQARQLALFQEALDALEMDGEVTTVDCSELPCFVHGTLAGHDSATLDDDLGRLIEETRRGMGDDDVYASRTIHEDPDANKADMMWSISWYPPEWHAADKEAFNKRVRFRKNEYADGIVP